MEPPLPPELRQKPDTDRETPAPTAHASQVAALAQARGWTDWSRGLAISAAAGVVLALLGALGTEDQPLLVRLLYWVPLIMGGSVVASFVTRFVLLIPRAGANAWIFGALLAIAVSIPVTVLVIAYTALFGSEFSLRALPSLYSAVLVITAAMTGIMMLASRPGAVTHAPPAGAATSPVRFMERLPPKLRGAVIYAVSAEDHYLRLHTSKGSDLILMRLSDAMVELEGLEGAQTHRSWWVARDAVESARREGDRMTLVLKGGAEAPVSRPNVKPLRDSGWY